ncbi:MAG: Fe-S cluster assembly protein SufD [Zetaproteobacteria bacterium]|nr:MAG: Fe-S cluster assembly protein SufD [Zetaproteobacteria bacterium]
MTQSIKMLRDAAWQVYEQAGLPTTRNEDWKYTDLSRLTAVLGETWWTPSHAADLNNETVEEQSIAELDAYRLVFANGRFQGDMPDLPEGVSVIPLSALLTSDAGKASKALEMDENAPLFNGAIAVNSAMASDGACICIADGVKLDKPLYLLHVTTSGGASHMRHGIWMGRGATAHVIEHYVGNSTEAGLTHNVTLVHLGEAATLYHDRLQLEAEKQFHLGRVDVKQLRDSRFVSHSLALGAALSRVDIAVSLSGANASCVLNGLYLIGGRQHADHHTRIDHISPDCTSQETYKGVLSGRAHAVFNGKVVVHKGADGTDAKQSNGNLLLSDHAEVDTKPELEIYADEVKCAHGATVGQLDMNQLFYLQSRGLSKTSAMNVLTFAFAEDVFARINIAPVRRHLERAALAKLPQGDALQELM